MSAARRFREATLARETGRLFKFQKKILCLILNNRPVSQSKDASRLFLTLLDPPLLARRGTLLALNSDASSMLLS